MKLRASVLLVGLAIAAMAAAADFDRSVAVARGTRLDVRLYGGQVIVRGWDRNEVVVRAAHFRSDEIDVRRVGSVLQLRARSRVGTPHAIDLEIRVPAWMDVAIAGTYVDVSVAGTRAAVRAETVRGDVEVTGGAGTIALKSIEGDVVLDGGEGRAELHAVNNSVRVTGWKGDLFAETVNGSVTLRTVQSTSVEVGTMGGDISWDGPMTGRGRYQLATHDGDIDVMVPADDGANVTVRNFQGRFRSTFPVELSDAAARRRRFSFTLGSGGTRLDLETFRGTISLRRP